MKALGSLAAFEGSPQAIGERKRLVRSMTWMAVRRGVLRRKTVCEVCCSPFRKVQMHHPNYYCADAHLKVLFLCSFCHARRHPEDERFF